MGNQPSIQKINFEDMQVVYKNPEIYLLINTLPENNQDCLILNTVKAITEVSLINNLVTKNKNAKIIIYGMNSNDESIYKKYNQLLSLGFNNISLYIGGIFEWLLLQDIYGNDEFPTTSKQLDILKYKSRQQLNIGLLENGSIFGKG
jgi:hypothetical protein